MYSCGFAGFGGCIMYFTPVLILTLLRHIFLQNLQFFLQFFGETKKAVRFQLFFSQQRKAKSVRKRGFELHRSKKFEDVTYKPLLYKPYASISIVDVTVW